MPYANNKGTDQPAHPRSLISAFVFRCLDGIISLVSISKISSRYLFSVAAQDDLDLTCSKIPEDMFSHDVAQDTIVFRILPKTPNEKRDAGSPG